MKIEIVIAMMTASRCRARGALRDRLERIYVAGLALWACGRIWPREAPWEQMGMQKLDWAWCREHEVFLWEELKTFLMHPIPRQPRFEWLLPDPPPSRFCPVPKGGSLFLGKALFESSLDDQALHDEICDLLRTSLPDILRAFRRKVGLESTGHASV